MACIDFSLDSRIRKKYVPLINQQRRLRHIKRVAARNLSIPDSTLDSSDLDTDSVKLNLSHFDDDGNDDDISPNENKQLLSLTPQSTFSFYFTLNYPKLEDCVCCSSNQMNKNGHSCICNKLLYRSETLIGPNPSWKSFEGSTLFSPSSSQLTIRIYYVPIEDSKSLVHNTSMSFNKPTANSNQVIGTLFLEWDVHISGLLYIGEEIPKDRLLSNNSIILGLDEGFYTSLCSVSSEELNHIPPPPTESMQDTFSIRPSYGLDYLTRIHMVQYIIQGTATHVQIARNRLENAFEKSKKIQNLQMAIQKTQSSNQLLSMILERRKLEFAKTRNRLKLIENEIFEHNSEMSSRIQVLKEEVNILLRSRSYKLMDTRQHLEQTRFAVVNRRRHLITNLFKDIYSIVPFPDFRGFSICDVYLPDAEHVDDHDSKMISIALGYVTHLVSILCILLDVHIHYQLIPFGSRSSIIDISNTVLRDNEKILPLYLRSGRNIMYFKYGFYLLNQTIAYIRRLVGLKTQTSATTLSNLYSLFTECLMVDNYNINSDSTLNRFNCYTPSVDSVKLSRSPPKEPSWNPNFLNDINIIKDNDYMNDWLWKEVEALTLHIAQSRPVSSSSTSSGIYQYLFSSNSSISSVQPQPATQSLNSDEIKQSILIQRQRRRKLSSHRLRQITSSITSSYSLTTSTPNRTRPALTAPEDIIRQRCTSTPHCFGDTINTSFSSPPRFSSSTSFKDIDSDSRIRSVSGYDPTGQQQLMSAPTQNSFLHPSSSGLQMASSVSPNINFRRRTNNKQQRHQSLSATRLSFSLDRDLNRLSLGNCSESHSSSINSSLSGDLAQHRGSPSSYLNVEIKYENNNSNESKLFDNSMEITPNDNEETFLPNNAGSTWLHNRASRNSNN